ncbi:MAG: hypothetical protein ACK56G_07160 [Pirellulaceae bacterium]|jgi:hypothetical protein
MHTIQFSLAGIDHDASRAARVAYLTSLEGIPWPCQIELQGDLLSLCREVGDSGKLTILWPTQTLGPVALSTATLRVQQEPYDLPLELARGTLVRVRNRAAEWEPFGIDAGKPFDQRIELAVESLLDCIIAPRFSKTSAQHAQQSIEQTLQAQQLLMEQMTAQMSTPTGPPAASSAPVVGFRISNSTNWKPLADLTKAQNQMAFIEIPWGGDSSSQWEKGLRDAGEKIEWCNRQRIPCAVGPLMSLQNQGIPPWMYLMEDYPSVVGLSLERMKRIVRAFAGKVQLWHVLSGVNASNQLHWDDQQLLQFIVQAVQLVHQLSPNSPLLLSIDQPWAEYLASRQNAYSPLHLADALLRANLGITAIGLEMNLDAWPGGSLPRDPLDVSDLIDQWSMLGIPLVGFLAASLHGGHDPAAFGQVEMPSQWLNAGNPPPDTLPLSKARELWIASVWNALRAKGNLHALVWNQIDDHAPHFLPNAGGFDSSGKLRFPFLLPRKR